MTTYEMGLMRDLQSTGFASLELQLYLDSHPDDADALQDYATIATRLRALRKAYERQVGPLIGFGDDHTINREGWVEQPWPWEYR